MTGDSARLLGRAVRAATELLDHGDADALGAGGDGGTGLAGPVVGLVFKVAADEPGEAMQAAVGIATEAVGPDGRGLFAANVVADPEGGVAASTSSDDLHSPTTSAARSARWRWVGTGGEIWHCRVDNVVVDQSQAQLDRAATAMSELLDGGGEHGRGALADQGDGNAASLIGLTFAVAADSAGLAAQHAVDAAAEALGPNARTLYGVSVFVAARAPDDFDEFYPPLMD